MPLTHLLWNTEDFPPSPFFFPRGKVPFVFWKEHRLSHPVCPFCPSTVFPWINELTSSYLSLLFCEVGMPLLSTELLSTFNDITEKALVRSRHWINVIILTSPTNSQYSISLINSLHSAQAIINTEEWSCKAGCLSELLVFLEDRKWAKEEMEGIPGFCVGFICMQKQASLLCSEDEFHPNGASESFKIS